MANEKYNPICFDRKNDRLIATSAADLNLRSRLKVAQANQNFSGATEDVELKEKAATAPQCTKDDLAKQQVFISDATKRGFAPSNGR